MRLTLLFCACMYFAVEIIAKKDLLRSQIFDDAPDTDEGPYFSPEIKTEIVSTVGKTISLHCIVKSLGNKTISWVRHRDVHLLTVGRYTYISDQRFEGIHQPFSEHWYLQIRNPQINDSGIYECQISITPPVGLAFNLQIVDPSVEILADSELYVEENTNMNLTCIVEFTPEIPSTVIWYFGDISINFDSPRGGINIVTEKGPRTISRLLVHKMRPSDSGIYICAPSNADPQQIRVHVVKASHPALNHQRKSADVNKMLMVLTPILMFYPPV